MVGAGGAAAGAGGSTDFPTRRTRTTTLRCYRVCRRKGRPCGETGLASADADVLVVL